MSRCRKFKHLDECVNHEYHGEWGRPVTVKDAIMYSIYCIEDRALRRISNCGELNVLLPNFIAKTQIVKYIFNTFTYKFQGTHVNLLIGDTKFGKNDIVVNFVPLTEHRPKFGIPVSWNDDLPQWTWKDVIAHGEYFSSSSTSIWPPLEYKLKAQRELVEQLKSSNPTIVNFNYK